MFSKYKMRVERGNGKQGKQFNNIYCSLNAYEIYMKAIYTLHITVFNLLLGIQREYLLYFYSLLFVQFMIITLLLFCL